MDERLRLVARLLEGDKLAVLCREFEISRKTGYKFYRRYCYPLTITDFATRYLITCEALDSTRESSAFSVFERAFKDFGLPSAIRTDNGIPFSCSHALFGLSRLSVASRLSSIRSLSAPLPQPRGPPVRIP